MSTGSVLAQFTITLSQAVSELVAVEWFTSDGTALAGVDYAANKGTAMFAPGETAKTVDILVYGRAVGSEDRSFFVEMDPPVNAILGASIGECIIHVDTTGSTPVTQIIVPTGPQGPEGKSAYQTWLDLGNTGTEQDFIDSLSPDPAELAQDVAPLIDVGDTVLTAEGTEALGKPDETTVKAVARRVAYVGAAKIATVVLADGDNLIAQSDLTGDTVDMSSVGLYPRIMRGPSVLSPQWSVEADGSLLIKNAVAGDVLYVCQYDVVSAQAVINQSKPIAISSFEALRRSYADAGYNVVGTFGAGFTIVNANDIGIDEATGKGYTGPAGHVAAGTNPVSGGFVDVSGSVLKTQIGAVSILEFDKDADTGYPHDAYPAWLKAKATGKQVIFPKPRTRYYMQGPMILEQTSIIGSGVGQAYGNTAVVIEFGGFTAEYAVESRVKINRFEGFYFTPRSWDPVTGFVGAGFKQSAMTVGIDSAFVGFKDGGHRVSLPSTDTTTESWLSRYVRCSFEFNGKHGAHYKDAGNGTSFIDCNGRWNGAPAFMVQPTALGVWDGIQIESDKTTGSLSRPEGFYLSGGDWSYNSRYGFDVQSGYGGVMNPGYIELNRKNGGRVGGTAKGWKVRPRHSGQSIERNIESLFQTPLAGTIAKMPNEIDAGGIPLGTGDLYGDNATTIPQLELASGGAMHKILTYNWSGIWGSILRLMTKTGDMTYRAVSTDGRVMRLFLDKVQLEDQQWNDKTHKLVAMVAREVTGLPTASSAYAYTMLFNVVDRKLYFCFYNSTAFEWKQVQLV